MERYIVGLEERIAELEAQLAAPRWEPVEDGEYVMACGGHVTVKGGRLLIADKSGQASTIDLSKRVSLCCLVQPTQEDEAWRHLEEGEDYDIPLAGD